MPNLHAGVQLFPPTRASTVGAVTFKPAKLSPEVVARSARWAAGERRCWAQQGAAFGAEAVTACGLIAVTKGRLAIPLCRLHGDPKSQATAMRYVRVCLRQLPAEFHGQSAGLRKAYLRKWLYAYQRALAYEVKCGLVAWANARAAVAAEGVRRRCPGCGCGQGAVCRIVWGPGEEGRCAAAGDVPGHVVCSGCVTARGGVVEVVTPPGCHGARNPVPGPFRPPAVVASRLRG